MELKVEDFETLVEEVLFEQIAPGTQILFDGEVLEFVDLQRNVEERRWAMINLAVFKRRNEYVGMFFDTPATEIQEDQGWFEYSTPEFVLVKPVETTVWVKK